MIVQALPLNLSSQVSTISESVLREKFGQFSQSFLSLQISFELRIQNLLQFSGQYRSTLIVGLEKVFSQIK